MKKLIVAILCMLIVGLSSCETGELVNDKLSSNNDDEVIVVEEETEDEVEIVEDEIEEIVEPVVRTILEYEGYNLELYIDVFGDREPHVTGLVSNGTDYLGVGYSWSHSGLFEDSNYESVTPYYFVYREDGTLEIELMDLYGIEGIIQDVIILENGNAVAIGDDYDGVKSKPYIFEFNNELEIVNFKYIETDTMTVPIAFDKNENGEFGIIGSNSVYSYQEIIVLDSDFELLFEIRYNTYSSVYFNDVISSDNEFIAVGRSGDPDYPTEERFNSNEADATIIVFDSNGVISETIIRKDLMDEFNDIELMSDGNYLILGNSKIGDKNIPTLTIINSSGVVIRSVDYMDNEYNQGLRLICDVEFCYFTTYGPINGLIKVNYLLEVQIEIPIDFDIMYRLRPYLIDGDIYIGLTTSMDIESPTNAHGYIFKVIYIEEEILD